MNTISNGVRQTDWSRTQANKPSHLSAGDEPAINDPWGSDRVDLSSAVEGATLNASWRDVFEIHGPRGVRTVCSETKPVAGPGERIRATPFSVGPAGSPLCR